eukprot:1238504-Prymnesium_polylepis.1
MGSNRPVSGNAANFFPLSSAIPPTPRSLLGAAAVAVPWARLARHGGQRVPDARGVGVRERPAARQAPCRRR